MSDAESNLGKFLLGTIFRDPCIERIDVELVQAKRLSLTIFTAANLEFWYLILISHHFL